MCRVNWNWVMTQTSFDCIVSALFVIAMTMGAVTAFMPNQSQLRFAYRALKRVGAVVQLLPPMRRTIRKPARSGPPEPASQRRSLSVVASGIFLKGGDHAAST
jgi:predicted TIM-barrel fold metal-dependent hydrolase